MKSTEQNFPVVQFTMLCEVVLTFKSVYEILKCDYSSESYCVFSNGRTVKINTTETQFPHQFTVLISLDRDHEVYTKVRLSKGAPAIQHSGSLTKVYGASWRVELHINLLHYSIHNPRY